MTVQPKATERRLTARDLWEMGHEADHCELDEGKLIRGMPAQIGHGKIAAKLDRMLGVFIEQHDLGEVYISEAGFELAEDTVRAPDISFVRKERIPAGGLPEEGFFPGAPDFAIEVLSPHDWEHPGAFQKKVGQYLEAGTKLIWVVDRRSMRVVVYRADGTVEVVGRDGVLSGQDVVPGFTCRVADFLPEPAAVPPPPASAGKERAAAPRKKARARSAGRRKRGT